MVLRNLLGSDAQGRAGSPKPKARANTGWWREVSANPRRTCAVDSGHVRVGHVQSLKKVRVAPTPKGSLKNLLGDIVTVLELVGGAVS